MISCTVYLMMLLACIITYIVNGKNLNITNIYIYMWSFLIIMSKIFIQYDYKVYSLLWIVLSMYAFIIGQKLSVKKVFVLTDVVINRTSHIYTIKNIDCILLTLIIAMGILYNILTASKYGIKLTSVNSLNALLAVNNYIANIRYNGDIQSNALSSIANIFVYSGPLCGGYTLLKSDKLYKKILCYLVFIPVIVNSLLTNTKAPITGCIILFMISSYVSYLDIHKTDFLFTIKMLIYAIILFVLMCVFFTFMFYLRAGGIYPGLVNKLFAYAFGCIPAFGSWFDSEIIGSCFFFNFDKYDYGTNTFMIIPILMGFITRKPGVYDFINGGYPNSNIYTMFRGIISDYGLFGGLVFITIISFISHICINNIKYLHKSNRLAKTILSLFAFLLLYGYIISPYVYFSYTFSFIVFYFFLYIVDNNANIKNKYEK